MNDPQYVTITHPAPSLPLTTKPTSVALPLDIGLDLKGMSNKLRSGSAAIANTYQPFDMQRERIVKHNGNIVYLESEPGPEPEPEPEDSDEGLDSEPIPLEELGDN